MKNIKIEIDDKIDVLIRINRSKITYNIIDPVLSIEISTNISDFVSNRIFTDVGFPVTMYFKNIDSLKYYNP